MYYLGIDIGTSSVCGVVYDAIHKKIESINKKNDSISRTINSWENIQDPIKIIFLVDEIVHQCFSKYPDIRGIGVTGQMHGILYVDGDGKAVSPLYTWQDNRGNEIYKKNKTYVQYLIEKTNYSLASGFGFVTHFFNIVNNRVPVTAKKLCTIMDYVVMNLTKNKKPLIDYTNAASLGFFDIRKNIFNLQSLKDVGIDTLIVPEIRESPSIAGYYKDTIPVYIAIGDNQASFLGSVNDVRKSIHITVGTSSQISIFTDKYIEIKSMDIRPFPTGGFLLVGAALCGGQSLMILKSFFESTLKLFEGESVQNINVFKTINSINSFSDNKDALIVQTTFDGTRDSPWIRGRISNISRYNFTPENLIIGFMKGISQELYDFYMIIPEYIKRDKNLVVGSGNAIKKNKILIKIFEEQFQKKLLLSEFEEEAAFGACMLSLMGETNHA